MTTTVELPYDPEKHSRARVLASYVSPLVAFGLELVTVEHGCVLANNPIEAGSDKAMARYRSWWNWMARRSKAKPRSARWFGTRGLCVGLGSNAYAGRPNDEVRFIAPPGWSWPEQRGTGHLSSTGHAAPRLSRAPSPCDSMCDHATLRNGRNQTPPARVDDAVPR